MWNPPETHPDTVGEYAAALEPAYVLPDIRRWWDGECWSNPYSVNAAPKTKERIRKEKSQFFVYWKK